MLPGVLTDCSTPCQQAQIPLPQSDLDLPFAAIRNQTRTSQRLFPCQGNLFTKPTDTAERDKNTFCTPKPTSKVRNGKRRCFLHVGVSVCSLASYDCLCPNSKSTCHFQPSRSSNCCTDPCTFCAGTAALDMNIQQWLVSTLLCPSKDTSVSYREQRFKSFSHKNPISHFV